MVSLASNLQSNYCTRGPSPTAAAMEEQEPCVRGGGGGDRGQRRHASHAYSSIHSVNLSLITGTAACGSQQGDGMGWGGEREWQAKAVAELLSPL